MVYVNNNIELILSDVEGISLSLDTAIKKVEPPLENLEVTPTKEQQVFNHEDSYGYDNVTVNPIPSEYIIPDGTLDVSENGDVDVTMFRKARVGVYIPPKLQEKSIEITENGEKSIVPDDGFDGLSSVEITANIEGGAIPKDQYVQDGLIAYFDARDEYANDLWKSRVGADYWYQAYPRSAQGKALMNALSVSDTMLSDGSFTLSNLEDYYLKNYTVELVGACSVSTNFFTFDKNQTPEIDIGRFGSGIFSPINVADGVKLLETQISGLYNKRNTMALNLKTITPRGTTSGKCVLLYSVNGSDWNIWGLNNMSNASSYKTDRSVIFGYYSTAGGQPCGINCIRIYNRRLTDKELAHNYELDKRNFHLGEFTTTRINFADLTGETISLETSGKESVYSGWGLYENIDVSDVDKIEYAAVPAYKNTSNGLELYGVIFYDENQNFISGVSPTNADKVVEIYGTKGPDVYITGLVDVPQNAKYMRVCGTSLFNAKQVPVINLIRNV